jgi:hypothetical protein
MSYKALYRKLNTMEHKSQGELIAISVPVRITAFDYPFGIFFFSLFTNCYDVSDGNLY